MKISVIMPTFNDQKSICETFDSLMQQTYNNWELIVVDDGSTDDTKETIINYKNKYDKNDQIKYYFQENQDQLKAIINGLNFVTGDYIFILHSDDLLASPDVFKNCINFFNENKNIDSIIADLIIIDENSKITGHQSVLDYKKRNYIPPLQLLWLGRNLYIDVAFSKKETFINQIKNNYLTWNTPFWLSTDNKKVEMLNVVKVNFPFIKYRVHSNNYINNEIGKLNVINGELRTAANLMSFYHIPLFKLQYILFRIFNKLKIFKMYKPIYYKGESKNKDFIIEFIIKKRFGDKYKENLFLNSLVEFYKNYKSRTVMLDKIDEEEIIYLGNMMRLFNKNLIANKLSPFYNKLFEEMKEGFNKIIVVDEENREKMINITKFFCIDKFVTIDIKKE